jgi:hypothetical protein
VFGANLDEGMNCADCHVKANTFVKNANDVAICATLASQLADQFAVSFEFGTRRFLRDRFQQGNFHGSNTGSNPVGDAKSFQQLTDSPLLQYKHKKGTILVVNANADP